MKKYRLFTLAILALVINSCNKKYFDTIPRTDILVSSSLPVLQALLDNEQIMNQAPNMGEISADNYYLTEVFWQSIPMPYERNCYIWAKDIYAGEQNVEDWSKCYTQVLHANVALEGLEKIPFTTGNKSEWNLVKGSALFFRANAFNNLAQLFANAYDSSTAETDPGIPLRLDTDINTRTPRSSIQKTYNKVLNDLEEAGNLLPPVIPFAKRNRPSKPAVLALKARIYLVMGDYVHAKAAAAEALELYDSLTDYKAIDKNDIFPFPKDNAETIFQCQLAPGDILGAYIFPGCIVDSGLYNSYSDNDLRRVLYYMTGLTTGQINIRTSYTGTIYPFGGLATDELFLIRSECNARLGNTQEALDDLNNLLSKRFAEGTFHPYSGISNGVALQLILQERRKELAFRGLRWPDLRRLTKRGLSLTLKRTISGTEYSLPPNDSRYTLPIPPAEIALSGIQQNPR